MAQVASLTTKTLEGILAANAGLPSTVGSVSGTDGLTLTAIANANIIVQNVPPEIAEKSLVTKYPAVHLYCEKVVNQLREKFRTFSGQAHMMVEVRVSSDRLDDLETQMQLYVEAVTQVLDANRGDWGGGVFYGGGYEVNYGTVKHGGRYLLQTAKISLVVEVSLA
jgi:hypothetical protein